MIVWFIFVFFNCVNKRFIFTTLVFSSPIFFALETTPVFLNLPFKIFRTVAIFCLHQQQFISIFASHYMTLPVDQEAFSICLYVCDTEGSRIYCLFSFSVLGLTCVPAQLKIIISGYETVNVLHNKGSLWMRSNKGGEHP